MPLKVRHDEIGAVQIGRFVEELGFTSLPETGQLASLTPTLP